MKAAWSCYRQAVLTYQSHIHRLARDVAGRASRILVQLTECVANPATVEQFGLPDDLDGHRLSNRLFNDGDATVAILTEQQRRACGNLYTSLYTLLRNPPSHGDVHLDRQLSEGGLTLLAWLLAVLENADGDRQLVDDAL